MAHKTNMTNRKSLITHSVISYYVSMITHSVQTAVVAMDAQAANNAVLRTCAACRSQGPRYRKCGAAGLCATAAQPVS